MEKPRIGFVLPALLVFFVVSVHPQQGWAGCRLGSTAQGIVSAEASSREEAYECFGRLHAGNRVEQMLLLRRIGQGRLAEEKGFSYLKTDFLMRLLELKQRSVQLAAELSAADRVMLEAYARGVNGAGSSALQADPWTVSDTLLLLLLQSFDQTRRSFMQDIVTDGHARQGHPLEMSFPWQTPILKPGEYAPGASRAAGVLYPFRPEDGATGSNNWVVSPRFTKKKVAMLSNDPHLALKSPPFWHWVRIRYPDHEVIGGSLPGVPVVVSGGSRHMAWGLTNSYVDVADAVLVPRAGLRTRKVRPLIWFKFGWLKLPFLFKTFEVVESKGLPVLPIEAPERGHAVVLQWTGFDVGEKDLRALWKLGESKSVAEMESNLRGFGLPAWNFVFADTLGNIAYRAVGRLPKRSWSKRGMLPIVQASALGSMPILTPDEAPHLVNPKRGWLATANQLQWGRDARDSVGETHTEAFRGFRIEELLQKGLAERHDLESFKKIICDDQAVDARFLLPVLLPRLPKVAPYLTWSDRFSRWDLRAGVECEECALYRLWMKELGDPQWVYARATQGTLEQKEIFFRESREALARAAQKLEPLGGPWVKWGRVHGAVFPPTEVERPFSPQEGALPLPTGGDDHSVAPGSSDFLDQGARSFFSHHSGASQRVIWEMTSPPTVHFRVPDSEAQRRAWRDCEFETFRFN